MIRQRKMGRDSWNLRLVDDAPRWLLDQVEFFTHIVITPADVPATSLSESALLAMSMFTAPIIRRGDRRLELGGFGPAEWLGPLGDVYEATFNPTKTFEDHLTDSNGVLRVGADGANGITAGAIAAGGSTAQLNVKAGSSPADYLQLACAQFGNEWRINPDLTLDADDPATMWAPLALTFVDGGGRGDQAGWRAIIEAPDDVEDYTTRVIVEAEDASTGDADISPATPYNDIAGDPVQRERYYVVTAAPSTPGATTAAGNRLALYDHVHLEAVVSLPDAYAPRLEIQPGDSVGVFDVDRGLYDLDVQAVHRGQTIFPTRLDVVDIEWPVQRGMGVHVFREPGVAPLRLTDYVVFEEGPTRVGLGERARRMRVTQGVSQ